MKLDMDLVRDIVLFVEAYYPRDHDGKPLEFLRLTDFPEHSIDKGELKYYVSMLMNEKILDYFPDHPIGQHLALTWDGHKFANEIRDPKWFAKIKKAIGKRQLTIASIRYTHQQLRKHADQIFVFWSTTAFWGIVSFFAWLFGFFG